MDTREVAKVFNAICEELKPLPGELECIASGYITYDDYRYIANALKKTSNLILDRNSEDPTARGRHQQQAEGWKRMQSKIRKFSVVPPGKLNLPKGEGGTATGKDQKNGNSLLRSPRSDAEDNASSSFATTKGKFLANVNLVKPLHIVENLYSDGHDVISSSTAATSNATAPADGSSTSTAEGSPEPRLQFRDALTVTRDDLAEITQMDEALEMFLELTFDKLPGYIQKKIKVLPPESVLEFIVHKNTLYENSKKDMTRASTSDATEDLLTPDASFQIRSGNWDDVFNKDYVYKCERGFEKVAAYTAKVSCKYMLCVAKALPYGINSRFNNNYLSPSIPVAPSFVTCGTYGSRRREFFVSLKDRISMLNDSYSFDSPEEILTCIAQFSNILSNMISSFSISALLYTVDRYHLVSSYMGLRELSGVQSDEPYMKDANGVELSIEGFEEFAKQLCKKYTSTCQTHLESLRRKFPNIFLISTLLSANATGELMSFREGNNGYENRKSNPNGPGGKSSPIPQQQIQEEPSVLSTLVSILVKLIFLFAGGLGSITADDRRGVIQDVLDLGMGKDYAQAFAGAKDILPDDIALADALHISSLNRIMWLQRLFVRDVEGTRNAAVHLQWVKACADVWRVYFQYIGILPIGASCPLSMLQWIKLLPMYLLEDEGKSAILHVHAALSNQQHVKLSPVMRENVLQSSSVLLRRQMDEMRSARMEGIASSISSNAANGNYKDSSKHVDVNIADRVPSMLVDPVFATKSNGVEKCEGGQGPRRDFFELCASENTDTFLPTIDITNMVKIRTYSGPVEELFGVCAETEEKVRESVTKQNPVFLVKWKQSLNYYTMIREGDILCVKLNIAVGEEPSIAENQKRLSIKAATDEELFSLTSPLHTNSKSDSKGKTNSGSNGESLDLSNSNAEELFSFDKRQSSNRSISVNSRQGFGSPVVATDGSGMPSLLSNPNIVTSSVTSGPITQHMLQFTVASVLRSNTENYQVVVLASPTGKNIANLYDNICGLYHMRRALPPFSNEETRRYAWTNPSFPVLTAGRGMKPGNNNSSFADIPYTIGWLLGSSAGNGVVFQSPIAPLAFRILSQAIRYHDAVSNMKLNVFDLNLICEEWTAEALQLTLRHPEAVLASFKIPSDGVLSKQLIHDMITKMVNELLYNINDSVRDSEHFWSEVLRGISDTPIVHTPLFSNCCARTLRSVLCGRVDNARRSFSFKEHFLISFDDSLAYMTYRKALTKWTLRCLDEVLNTEERRLMLRFITGRALLPHKRRSEIIHIVFESFDIREPAECLKFSRRLPTSHTCDNTLYIPNFLELLLVSPSSRYAQANLLDGGKKKRLRVIVPSDYNSAFLSLTPEELQKLEDEYISLLATRFLTSIYETNGFTDDNTLDDRKRKISGTINLGRLQVNPVPGLDEGKFESVLVRMGESEADVELTSQLTSATFALSPTQHARSLASPHSPLRQQRHGDSLERHASKDSNSSADDEEPEFGFYRLIRVAETDGDDRFNKKLNDRQKYISQNEGEEVKVDVKAMKAINTNPKSELLSPEKSRSEAGSSSPLSPLGMRVPAPPQLGDLRAGKAPEPIRNAVSFSGRGSEAASNSTSTTNYSKDTSASPKRYHKVSAHNFDLEDSATMLGCKSYSAHANSISMESVDNISREGNNNNNKSNNSNSSTTASGPAIRSVAKMPASLRHLEERLLSKNASTRQSSEGQQMRGTSLRTSKKNSVDEAIEDLFPSLK